MSADREQRLVHFHIGGRAGSTSLIAPPGFAKDIALVLFDADEGCISQAEKDAGATFSDVISAPYFIGRGGGETTFHVNYDPFSSSAYLLNPYFREYWTSVGGTDYVLGEVTQPVSEIKVPSHSLDSLCTGPEAILTAPDLLTIDAQASEFDILRGASALLDDYVVTIIAEVQFSDVYRGGARFGEISDYLQSKGFLFAAFNRFDHYAPLRGRIGARGAGLCLFADALFFRDPHLMASTWGDRADPALRKLAFLAICHHQLEFAQLCLGLCSQSGVPAEGLAYLGLLRDFEAACALLPEPRPWTYGEAYDAETSSAFHQQPSDAVAERIRETMAAKVPREHGKLREMSSGTDGVVQVLERYGFLFAANISTHQEEMLKAYADSVNRWQRPGLAPANDRG